MIDAKTIYKNYPVKVQEYMDNVIKCLIDDYGNIPAAWRISLDLIADSYSLYLDCLDDIKNRGVVTKGRTGEMVKNVSFSILDRTSTTITNLLKSFSLTPLSRAKMRALTKNEDPENLDDYLDSLTA